MLKIVYEMDGMWCIELMYPKEYQLFRLTKPDYVRIRHIEKV